MLSVRRLKAAARLRGSPGVVGLSLIDCIEISNKEKESRERISSQAFTLTAVLFPLPYCCIIPLYVGAVLFAVFLLVSLLVFLQSFHTAFTATSNALKIIGHKRPAAFNAYPLIFHALILFLIVVILYL